MNISTSLPPVPTNDLKRLFETRAEGLLAAANRTFASGWWINGREVENFCQEFAAFVGTTNCIAVANGTDALEIAMGVLARRDAAGRREIITVPNAGGYSAIAARLVGLVPAYADIDEASQLGSLESMVSLLSDDTALVVATHLYGGVLDVVRLRAMMDAAGYDRVPILEDCAQAHGAELNGRRVGSLGDVATFSFYPTKNLGAFGDGGAIVTSNDDLAAACRAGRQYGWSSKYTIAAPGGRNSRLDEVQAAILRVLLPDLDAANAKRRSILDRYEEAAPASVPVVRSDEGTVAHLAVVLCDDRDGLARHLKENGVMSEIHYPILDCDQPAWASLPQRLASGNLETARRSVNRILTLPCFPDMTPGEVDRVCKALAAWKA